MAPHGWSLRLSEPAESDLVGILQWTSTTFGPRQADVYRGSLLAALAVLERGPDVAGSLARDDIRPGLRSLHVARGGRRGRHFVLYREAGSRTIEIVRILHDAMELSRHVPPEVSSEE